MIPRGKIVKELQYCIICEENLRHVSRNGRMTKLCKRCWKEYGKELQLRKRVINLHETARQSLKRRYLEEGFGP